MVLLPALNPVCSSANISSAYFQHDFARMTDKADSSVILAELEVALFRECNNQRLHVVCHSPVLQFLLQISVKTSILAFPPG